MTEEVLLGVVLQPWRRRLAPVRHFVSLIASVASLALAGSSIVQARVPDPSAVESPGGEEPAAEEPAVAEPPLRRNALVADLSLGVVSVGFERALTPNVSLSLAVGLYGPWYETENVIGFGAEARGFYSYPDERSRHRLYVSPGFRVAAVQTRESDPVRRGLAYSARLSVGWSATFSWFLLRLGLGVQYHVANLDEPAIGQGDDFDGVAPVADIYVGYVF